ncbi:hypothetical protein Tco_1443627 [Tanacetum coccineum]
MKKGMALDLAFPPFSGLFYYISNLRGKGIMGASVGTGGEIIMLPKGMYAAAISKLVADKVAEALEVDRAARTIQMLLEGLVEMMAKVGHHSFENVH